MKQHITVEQLKELSEFGKSRLIEWKRKTDPALFRVKEYGEFETSGVPTFEFLLSIGQMIEFLYEKNKDTPAVVVLAFIRKLNNDYLEVKNPEYWCDTLWEAVKEVLEK